VYRGRFAPSPTGALHFGSLLAAVGSYLDARANQGQWLVRIEDIDPPRELPGASDAILVTLEQYGLCWDGEVMYQSRRSPAYADSLARLQQDGQTYPCTCSRRDIMLAAADYSEAVYPGTCRNGIPAGRTPRSIRVRVADDVSIGFHDRLQGEQHEHLSPTSGDFVLRRADGLYAYQLAVVVDDAAQGITDIVRGADLLDSTARQIYLQQLLGFTTPRYLHLPVATNAAGEKLSKQTLAKAVPLERPLAVLCAVLGFLGQTPPADLTTASIDEFWHWAISHWNPARLPACKLIEHIDTP
jgi:glutamyl-Q tRNA(Asp) synthetase